MVQWSFSCWISLYEEPVELQSYVEPPPCFVYFLKKSYEKDCEIWSAHKNVISIASDVAKQEPWSVVSCDCMLC